MRLLPAASAALIASIALSTTAAARPAGDPWQTTARQAEPARAVSAPVGSGPVGSALVGNQAQVVADAAVPGNTGLRRPGRFAWPLSPRPGVLRRFEQPASQWSPGHRGADLAADVGQQVLSAGDGVVAFSGVIAGRGVVTVRHSDGLRTTYEPVEERLASETVVKRGTPIGVISPTPGHCVPRTCLHWGAISERTYRDPLSLLGFGHPVLLPLG
jgi:murein DD-endopeptidase MepM/ murein hydrolase activator NlpD